MLLQMDASVAPPKLMIRSPSLLDNFRILSGNEIGIQSPLSRIKRKLQGSFICMYSR
jgi:hypothetical protein